MNTNSSVNCWNNAQDALNATGMYVMLGGYTDFSFDERGHGSLRVLAHFKWGVQTTAPFYFGTRPLEKFFCGFTRFGGVDFGGSKIAAIGTLNALEI
jgi:hypothetical protein